jgi:hypothetical protein
MKHIKLFEDFANESKEKFPDQIEGNDGIIFKKVSQSGDRAKYNQYYRGYDIDAGGHVFGNVAELERFMKDYILSTNLYNKYKHMPEKPIGESLEEAEGRDTLAELNEMALGQLERIADYANMIKDRMIKGEQLESWMFSQLTTSLDNLNSVHDAMDGNDETVESVEEAISVDASYVHQITGCGQDAAQNFIDDNKIDGKKLADYVKQHRDSKEKYDVRDIIAGTGVGANKSFVKRFIKELK